MRAFVAVSLSSDLRSRRAQASPLLSSIQQLGEARLPPEWKGSQAESTRPGRVVRWAARLRRTLAFGSVGLPTGGGDRQIADCSAVNLRYCRITSATTSSCLRVFVFAMSCSVFLLCALRVSVVPWRGFVWESGRGPARKREIPNSEFRIPTSLSDARSEAEVL